MPEAVERNDHNEYQPPILLSNRMAQIDRLLLRSSPSQDTTPEMGILLGHALAMDCKRVVIARDLMKSSTMMKEALVAGLTSSGTDVIDLGCTSAPVVAMMAGLGDCAVYITEYREFGLVSGYILMNPDGSLFRKDQIRHLDLVFADSPPLPDYRHLGSVRQFGSATEEYNRRLRSVLSSGMGSTVILDCNCGMSADSAPQILNALGSDVITINAQKDRNFMTKSLTTTDSELRELRQFIESDPGTIGISLNRIGTLITVLDEKGTTIDNETLLALMVLFLKPKRLVVPADISSLVSDAFWGRIDIDLKGQATSSPDEDREFVLAPLDAGAVCNLVSSSSAELGFYDGGFIFGDVSMMSDGIYASAIVSCIAGENSLARIVDELPEYHRDSKKFHYECTRDEFSRMVEENLHSLNGEMINRVDGWRVDFDGGWFYLRFDKDSDDTLTVVAESSDRAYLIGLMEVAGDLVNACAMGQ